MVFCDLLYEAVWSYLNVMVVYSEISCDAY